MNKLISICIPTYNRSEYLKECLDTITKYGDKFDIPIYIMDNASTDETLTVVNSLKKKYKFIYYFCQDQNKSADENMLDVVSLSDTKYSWILGDDDIIKENAFVEILDLIYKNPELELLILNAEFISHDLAKIYGKLFELNRPEYFNDCIKLFEKHSAHTPCGNFLVKTDLYKSNMTDKYYGSSHAYSGIVWEYLLSQFNKNQRNNVIVTSATYVYLRCGMKSWDKYASEVFLNHIPLWYEVLPNIYVENTNAFDNYIKQQNSLINMLLLKKANKLDCIYNARLYVHFNVIQKLKVKFVDCFIPNSIVGFLLYFKEIIKYLKQKIQSRVTRL